VTELCIKTVIRLCTGKSHLVWRTRYTDTFCSAVDCRFELALEVQRWTRARSECLPGGPKNYSYATALCGLFTALELNGTERPFANSSPIKIHVLTAKRQRELHVRCNVYSQSIRNSDDNALDQSINSWLYVILFHIYASCFFCHHLVGKNYCHCASA